MAVKQAATGKKARGKGKPFQPGPDPRRNLAGRPKGQTIKEALQKWLKAETVDGATQAGAIAEALVKRAITGDTFALTMIVSLTEDRPADDTGTARLLISLDK